MPTFNRVAEALNVGDEVRIVDWSDRVVRGQIATLTADEIALVRAGGATERLARIEVREVSVRRRDPVKNGALIGFVSVAVPYCALVAGLGSAIQCGLPTIALGGLGAGLGALIDAAITRWVVVFRAAVRPVALQLAPAHGGVAAQPVVSSSPSHDVPIAGDGGRLRQSAPAPAARRFPSRPWTLSVVTGLPSRGPLHDLERTMRDTGFDLDSGGCVFGLCFESTSNPYSSGGRPFRDSWTAGLSRRIGPRLGVSVTGGRTLIGWTTGRHRGTGAYLEIETAMTHVAPLVTFTPTPGVRVGAGPGVFSTTFARTGLDPQPLVTARRPGLLAEASLTFPRRSRVFAELSAQQRWLGRQPLGPIDVLPDGTAPFPQTRVRVTHWFIGLGAGVRL